jgi:hypothetical protein
MALPSQPAGTSRKPRPEASPMGDEPCDLRSSGESASGRGFRPYRRPVDPAAAAADAVVRRALALQPGLCAFARRPGRVIVIEVPGAE